MTMAKLMFGKLTEAWKGEAADFTPLLAEQLDNLGEAIGIDLTAVGKSEVPTAGGRRIDIVATGEDGAEFVVENQYGRGIMTTSHAALPTPSPARPAGSSSSLRNTATSSRRLRPT